MAAVEEKKHYESCVFCKGFIKRFGNFDNLHECCECGFENYNAGCTNPECSFWWVDYIPESNESFYICDEYKNGNRCIELDNNQLLRETASSIDELDQRVYEYANKHGISIQVARIKLIRERKNKKRREVEKKEYNDESEEDESDDDDNGDESEENESEEDDNGDESEENESDDDDNGDNGDNGGDSGAPSNAFGNLKL